MNDSRAHMLLASSMFLVIGFTILGTTLIATNHLETATRNEQENDLITDASLLLGELNLTLQQIVPGSDPDVAQYKNLTEGIQQSLQDKASRAGFYAKVRLDPDPDPDSYRRTSRCLGYDPDRTRDGVIVGLDNDTHRTRVAGAAYKVHMTDGDRVFRTDHYVRFFQCTSDKIPTHAVDSRVLLGILENLTHSTKNDDTMNITEVKGGQVVIINQVSPRIDPDSLQTHHWSQPRNLETADGETAKHPSNEASNHIRFQLEPPEGMGPDDMLVVPEFKMIASHNEAPRFNQPLMLRVYHPADNRTPAIEKEIGPLTEELQEFTPDIRESPTGGPNWTLDEIEDSKWELVVTGTHNPNREIYVDHFNMTGDLWLSPYRLNATLEWEDIPHLFDEHELTLRYKIEPGTTDEAFRLQTRDTGPGGNKTWWNLTTLEAESDGQGGWRTRTLTVSVPMEGTRLKVPEFRIVDLDTTDTTEPEDQDTIQVELMRLTSRISGS